MSKIYINFRLLSIQFWISILVKIGQNFVEYYLNNRDVTFYYNTVEQYSSFVTGIDEENSRLRRENLPIGFFDLSNSYDAIVDIGGYIGIYSVLFKKFNPNIDVYAFEPGEVNFRQMQGTFRINNVDIHARNEVVTGESGQITFYERPSSVSGGNSTQPFQTNRDLQKERNVESVSLSDFSEESGYDSLFVKIDAEGEEYEIVKDITESEQIMECSGLLEIHEYKMNNHNRDDVLNLLEDNDFKYQHIPGRGDDGRYIFSNCHQPSNLLEQ